MSNINTAKKINKLTKKRYFTNIKWTPYLATAYAEGFCEGENATQDEQHDAWQYIIDNNLARNLQGWFGRTAQQLLENKIILPKNGQKTKKDTHSKSKRSTKTMDS